MLLNPFCPITTAKVLALKATVQIVAGSALAIFLLLLQTLVFLAMQQGRPASFIVGGQPAKEPASGCC